MRSIEIGETLQVFSLVSSNQLLYVSLLLILKICQMLIETAETSKECRTDSLGNPPHQVGHLYVNSEVAYVVHNIARLGFGLKLAVSAMKCA